VIDDVEQALVSHWSRFGRWRHGRLRDEQGLPSFETPVSSLPYRPAGAGSGRG
jgi:hypothetical protein